MRAEVVNAESSAALDEALVMVSVAEASAMSAVSEPNGAAYFPTMEMPAPVNGEQVTVEVTAEVARGGYLPFKRKEWITQASPIIPCALVSTSSGMKTPVVKAASGGTFALEGYGVLTVDPNVLTQDAYLHLIVLPSWSSSHGLVDDGVLEYQVWLDALDASGAQRNSLLPTTPGGIRLTVTGPFFEIKGPKASEAWVTHNFGEVFAHETVGAASRRDDGVVSMPLALGHNLLVHTYTVQDPASGCSGHWTQWEPSFKFLRTHGVASSTTAVICGVVTARIEAHTTEGQKVETDSSVSAEITSELGFTDGIPLAKITGKIGSKISASMGSSKVTTYVNKGDVIKGDRAYPDNTLTNTPSGQQPPGFDCVSGNVCVGLVYNVYDVWATRRCIGTPSYAVHAHLGEVEICQGAGWWATGTTPADPLPKVDTTCPNCSGCGGLPSTLPVMPML